MTYIGTQVQPMISTRGTTYTAAQVQALITGQNGVERWLWKRLDRYGNELADITSFVGKTGSAPGVQGHVAPQVGFTRAMATTGTMVMVPSIDHDVSRAVHRQLRLSIRGDAALNWVSDMIEPHYELQSPDGGWLDWPMGRFVTTQPNKEITDAVSWHTVTMSDQTQVLADAGFTDTYTVPQGTNYIAAVRQLASGYVIPDASGSPAMLIADPGKVTPTSLSWSPGQTRLQAINDLLGAVVYNDVWFDGYGRMRSEPMIDYTTLNPGFIFDTTQPGGTIVGYVLKEALDLSSCYNEVLVTAQDPNRVALSSLYVNANPLSPTSTVNWRPKLIHVTDSTITDQPSLNIYAQRLAQSYARLHAAVTADTLAWPLSQNLDAYGFTFKTKDEGLSQFTYVETKWTMNCAAGSPTTHSWQRVYPV